MTFNIPPNPINPNINLNPINPPDLPPSITADDLPKDIGHNSPGNLLTLVTISDSSHNTLAHSIDLSTTLMGSAFLSILKRCCPQKSMPSDGVKNISSKLLQCKKGLQHIFDFIKKTFKKGIRNISSSSASSSAFAQPDLNDLQTDTTPNLHKKPTKTNTLTLGQKSFDKKSVINRLTSQESFQTLAQEIHSSEDLCHFLVFLGEINHPLNASQLAYTFSIHNEPKKNLLEYIKDTVNQLSCYEQDLTIESFKTNHDCLLDYIENNKLTEEFIKKFRTDTDKEKSPLILAIKNIQYWIESDTEQEKPRFLEKLREVGVEEEFIQFFRWKCQPNTTPTYDNPDGVDPLTHRTVSTRHQKEMVKRLLPSKITPSAPPSNNEAIAHFLKTGTLSDTLKQSTVEEWEKFSNDLESYIQKLLTTRDVVTQINQLHALSETFIPESHGKINQDLYSLLDLQQKIQWALKKELPIPEEPDKELLSDNKIHDIVDSLQIRIKKHDRDKIKEDLSTDPMIMSNRENIIEHIKDRKESMNTDIENMIFLREKIKQPQMFNDVIETKQEYIRDFDKLIKLLKRLPK